MKSISLEKKTKREKYAGISIPQTKSLNAPESSGNQRDH